MVDEGKKGGSLYRDIPLFIFLIPLINALNYYLTYSSIAFNGHTLLTFTIDTLQGYAAWWVMRMIIIQLDRKFPYSLNPLKRIGVQLILTIAAALVIIILTTEIINRIAKDTPVPASFYRIDIFIFIIWFFVINGVYTGWHYYIQWSESEKLRQEEKKIRQHGFTVRTGKKSLNISFAEIAGIYVEGEYSVLITTDSKKYLLDQSLDKAEKSLPPELFFRLNRKYILHRRMIIGFERAENARINILLTPSANFPDIVETSRLKAPAFKAWFQQENL